ncbi:MAG: ROK family protein [Enterococcus lacertideformus]|uniref:ROK family protein n=1 Tax=Enterococcus lacertideformus TaxID=2771493 RepID=A0A931AW15_9ENTE|nr:ROK family protein [Enterococcus lacertideformus]
MTTLGIDIGGTMIKTALVHQTKISYKNRFPTPKKKEEFHQSLSEIIQYYKQIQPIQKIAFSVPGSVNESGTVFFGGAVPYLDQIQLKSFLKLGNMEITVENDAKAATACEIHYGNLKNVHHGAAIILGTGVGMGLCIDGQLYKGGHYQAGEISFMIRDRQISGQDSFVGMGLSSVLLIKKLAELLNVENDGEKVFSMLESSENSVAKELFFCYCKEIAILCFNIQTLLDIEKIVIGGGISQQKYLIKTVQQAYQALFEVAPIIKKTLQPMTIEAAKFQADANLIGAVIKEK